MVLVVLVWLWSALWCPLATPTVLLGFLLPGTWGISSRLLQQSAAAAPYLGQGVSYHVGHHPWPQAWGSSYRLPPWPWRWGSSSWLPPLTSDVGKLLSAAAPALLQPGALGCYSWPQARGSSSRPRFCAVLHSRHASAFVAWSEVKVSQSCPTLCNHMDYTVPGILQARILE